MTPPTARAPRLRRADRRDQILAAAARAFTSRGGYSGTTLDDVAEEAAVTKMILYRHFESKEELYRAAIDRAARLLFEAAMAPGHQLSEDSVPAIMSWAAAEPAAFRLLFRHARNEPRFHGEIEELHGGMRTALQRHLPEGDPRWRSWTAHLATVTVIEGTLAWLDEGAPDPGHAPTRLLMAVDGIYRAYEDA